MVNHRRIVWSIGSGDYKRFAKYENLAERHYKFFVWSSMEKKIIYGYDGYVMVIRTIVFVLENDWFHIFSRLNNHRLIYVEINKFHWHAEKQKRHSYEKKNLVWSCICWWGRDDILLTHTFGFMFRNIDRTIAIV